MNKHQMVWLIVRFIGVCFLFWAVLSLFSAFANYSSSGSESSATGSTPNAARVQAPTPVVVNPALPVPKSESEKAEEKAKSDALKSLAWQVFVALIYGGIGFYLIRHGKILYSVLSREESFDETEEIASSVKSRSDKNQVTTIDISPGATSKKEEVTSLNLTEYIPRSKNNDSLKAEEPIQNTENTVPIEQTEFAETPPQIETNQPEKDSVVSAKKPTLLSETEIGSNDNLLEITESPTVEKASKRRDTRDKEINLPEDVS